MLITCPHCGKEISDKAKQCIHCHTAIAEQNSTISSNPKTDYLSLSTEEQKSLQEEFFKEFPQHKKTLKTHEKLSFLKPFVLLGTILCTLMFTITTDCLTTRASTFEEQLSNFLFFLLLGFVCTILIVLISFMIIARIFKKKRLNVYIAQNQWLENKNIFNFLQSIALTQKEYKKININTNHKGDTI